MMRGKLALLGGCVLGVVVGSEARAASLLDGTPGMLTGWAGPIGFVSVVDNSFVPPSAGPGYRMLLSTGGNHDGNAPLVAAVEGYVGGVVDVGGHPGFDAGGAVEGSAIRRTFTASAGDTLTISYDFLTAEGSAALSELSREDLSLLPSIYTDDFAFVAITHAGITQVLRLADVLTPGSVDIFDLSGERFWYHTGFRSLTLTLPSGPDVTDGSYAIAFGVMDGAGDVAEEGHIGESALLIESIQVNGPSAVPVPAAAPAGAALIGALAAVRRFRRVW